VQYLFYNENEKVKTHIHTHDRKVQKYKHFNNNNINKEEEEEEEEEEAIQKTPLLCNDLHECIDLVSPRARRLSTQQLHLTIGLPLHLH
jgi:hypothetical protein